MACRAVGCGLQGLRSTEVVSFFSIEGKRYWVIPAGVWLWHRAGLSHRLGDLFRPCVGRHKVPGENIFTDKKQNLKNIFAGTRRA